MKNQSNRFRLFLAIASGLVALHGCGGGNDNASSAEAIQTFPFKVALDRFYATDASNLFAASGSVSLLPGIVINAAGSILLTHLAETAASFEGQPALRRTQTIDGTVGSGPVVDFSVATQTYVSATHELVGSSSSSSYCVAMAPSKSPASVRWGDAGTIAELTCYANSAKLSATGTQAISFTVSPGNLSNEANVQISTQLTDASNKPVSTFQVSYTVTAAGALTPRAVALTDTVSATAGSVGVDLTGI